MCCVHGLDEEKTRPEELACLFSSFGEVACVFMPTPDSTAGVRMRTSHQCRAAVEQLRGVVLHGRQITVAWGEEGGRQTGERGGPALRRGAGGRAAEGPARRRRPFGVPSAPRFVVDACDVLCVREAQGPPQNVFKLNNI